MHYVLLGVTDTNSYAANVDKLNAITPLEITLTPEVEHYINYFLQKRKSDLAIYIERSKLYFPLIESTLDKYNLPLELKYLAVIESGLDPLARSSSGAVGLWQFLYNTCSLVGLQVDSYIDERRDPYKATDAACRYIEYLFRTFNDWNLVMAAYNGGPGEVRKAIERSGGKTNYWELRPSLSKQAMNYVPQFIAMFYVMHYSQHYNIPERQPAYYFPETDTLHINYAVSFKQISAVTDITIDTLKLLNPQYKQNYIPDREESCLLILPKSKIKKYLNSESDILSYTEEKTDYNTLLAKAGNTDNKTLYVHTVQPGEYCHKIALNYNCTIENLRAWNNLDSLELSTGQTLNIWLNKK